MSVMIEVYCFSYYFEKNIRQRTLYVVFHSTHITKMQMHGKLRNHMHNYRNVLIFVTVQTLFFSHWTLQSHLCKSAAPLWCVYSNAVHRSIMWIWIQPLWSRRTSHESDEEIPACPPEKLQFQPHHQPHNRAPSNDMLRVTMETLIPVSARLDHLTLSASS